MIQVSQHLIISIVIIYSLSRVWVIATYTVLHIVFIHFLIWSQGSWGRTLVELKNIQKCQNYQEQLFNLFQRVRVMTGMEKVSFKMKIGLHKTYHFQPPSLSPRFMERIRSQYYQMGMYKHCSIFVSDHKNIPISDTRDSLFHKNYPKCHIINFVRLLTPLTL